MKNNNSDVAAVIRRSPFGWYGVAGDEQAVTFVTMGQASRQDVQARLTQASQPVAGQASSLVRDAADQIGQYFDGEPVDLSRIPIAAGDRTPFQLRVIQALRRVGYGKTVSYGELAERAKAPRAARAVGTIMANNRTPLLVPCHRVLAAGGRIGGFTAAQGVCLKEALLAMEAGEAAPAQRLSPPVATIRRRKSTHTTQTSALHRH
jgi:methylated-DNA-[protein]-cysteine S-methyltransferase